MAGDLPVKQRVWNLVEAGKGPSGPDGEPGENFDWFDRLIAALIVLNVIAFILESEPALNRDYGRAFYAFEVFSLIVFTIEYVLRLWSCTVVPGYSHPVTGRLKFATRPLQIIDLLAILPGLLFFLPDLRFVRALRLLRILRVLKLGRYSDAVTLLARVLKKRKAELLVMGLMLVILLVVAASMLYYAESDAQPDKFGSITRSLWWAVVTLTTIGYGDVFPITPLGKVLGGVIAVTGIGIVALPTAIIASGYSEEIQRAREARQRVRARKTQGHQHSINCPHCGKAIELHKGE